MRLDPRWINIGIETDATEVMSYNDGRGRRRAPS